MVERWQALQDRPRAGTCTVCGRRALQDGTRCARHSATTAQGRAWRDGRRLRLTRRGKVARVVLLALAAWAAWQAAGIVADGAVDGIGGAQAHGAQVATAGQGTACATVDTGRNVVSMGARRWRYRDTGDGIAWPARMPAQARALALAGIDARRAAEPIGRPTTVTTCATWRDR